MTRPAKTYSPDLPALLEELRVALDDTLNREGIGGLDAWYLTEAISMVSTTKAATMTLPGESRLARVLAWLQETTPETARERRELAVSQIHDIWPTYQAVLERDRWPTLPTTEVHIDDLELPESAKVRSYPVWEDSPAGQAAERFNCLALGAWYLNRKVGLPVQNLTRSAKPATKPDDQSESSGLFARTTDRRVWK